MPETDTRRFRIVEIDTTGWNPIPEAVNLSKEQCDTELNEFIRNGAAPSTLKVVLDSDPKYQFDTKNKGYFPVE